MDDGIRVDQRFAELISKNGECYPFEEGNLHEALGEIGMDSIAEFRKCLECGLASDLGMLLRQSVIQYWHKWANKRAEREIYEEIK